MDPDSLKGRLLISIVDKLLIGLAATLVVFYVQSSDRRDALVDQERSAVAGVVTEELANQRSRLMASVSGLVGLVNRFRAVGTVRDDEDAVARVSDLEQDIHDSLAVLQTVHATRTMATCEPRDPDVLDAFGESITIGLALPLMTSTMEPQEMQMRLDALLVAYANVLEFTRCLAIDTVHYEVARLYE